MGPAENEKEDENVLTLRPNELDAGQKLDGSGSGGMNDRMTGDTARLNVDVVQRTYEAVGRGDIPAVLDLMTDDVEWIFQGPPAIPFAGTRRGRGEVAEFFSLVGETLEFQQFEPREFVAQGDSVVVLGYERNLITPTGRTFEQEWAHVYTLRVGKIAKARFFEDTAPYVVAFDAA